MIIKRLTLHNFGIYADDNTFDFKYLKTRSVSLIGGMNGRGKTTFLEAVLLALYGQNSFAVLESNYKSYGEYLRTHINTSDGTNKAYVELEFIMDDNNEKTSYVVTRSWNANVKHIKDVIKVKKNNVEDRFLTQNWTMFIESILPSGLANFFFFDGEKIAELAETEINSGMKDSIKALLGINVIDVLQNDLKRVLNRVEDEQVSDYSVIKIQALQAEKEEKEEGYNTIVNEISDIELEISKTDKKLLAKRGEFEAKGGNIDELSSDLFNEKTSLESQTEQLRSQYEEFASGILPLAMVKSLLNEIQDRSRKEREIQNMRLAVDTISDLLKSYSGSKKEISKFIGFLKDHKLDDEYSLVFRLSEIAHSQLSLLNSGELIKAENAYKSSKERDQFILQRINEIDNYLSVDIDKKEIRRLYKEICKLDAEKIQLEAQLEVKRKECITAHGEAQKVTSEFNRCVEESLKKMEREDDLKRIKAYAIRAQIVSERYKIELQKAKVQQLSDTMTECCKLLFGKRYFIERVEMNAETLDYSYFDKNGTEISKGSLSAGEKQLMVISMLWALAKCSGKNLPIIIDTPLARLDSVHRTALINRYFSKASKQTIILSTDVEIDSKYYGKMEQYIGNEFTLVYNDETKRSVIEKGYFKGEIV